ncbi:MAG: hypothetical protein H0U75_09055 [Legionella sp.]|nr:hypothetical protein [Legionella sp.]
MYSNSEHIHFNQAVSPNTTEKSKEDKSTTTANASHVSVPSLTIEKNLGRKKWDASRIEANNGNKNSAIAELKKTERAYNVSLVLLIEAFVKNPTSNAYLNKMRAYIELLKNSSDRLLHDLDMLFPNPIKKVSAKKNLKELPQDFTSTQNNDTQKKSALYLTFGYIITNLQKYLTTYDTHQHESMQDAASFIRMDAWLRTNSKNKLGFNDHLAMPFQRGPRYVLIIEQILKKPDYIDPQIIETIQHLQQGCMTALNELNDSLPNRDEEYKSLIKKISLYCSKLEIQKSIKTRNTTEKLLKAIQSVLGELDKKNDSISAITRNDILSQTYDMLFEVAPLIKTNKIIHYRKSAAMFPGHAISPSDTLGLGMAMLLLSSTLAAFIVFMASVPLSIPVIVGTTIGAVVVAGGVTFFGSRHQTGIAKAACQLANEFQEYAPT